MIDTLLIALNEDDISIKWAVFAGAREIENGKVTELAELAEKANDRKVVAWLSSEQIVLMELEVPASQQRNLRQVVPGLLEENLATDIEQLHFAIGDKTITGNVTVAVVEDSIVKYWIDQFKVAEIKLDALLPGGLSLPWSGNNWTIQCDGSHCEIRVAAQSAFTFERENLASLLPKIAKQWGSPRTIHCFTSAEEQEQLQFGFPTDFRNDKIEKQGLFPDAYAFAMNLLQGDYLVKKDYRQHWRKWRFSAMLALAVMGLYLASMAVNTYRLNQQALSYKEETASLFRNAFPNETRLVNPKAQMAEQVQKMRSKSNSSGFLILLQRIAPILKLTSDVHLTRIKYEQDLNAIVLDVKAKSYEGLEQLKLQLEQASFVVELGSVSGRQNAYSARVVIGSEQ